MLVNHTTRIILRVAADKLPYENIYNNGIPTPESVRDFGSFLLHRTERVASIMEFLADKGFSFKGEKGYIYADSNDIEAHEVKRLLSDSGFKDYEFQVFLEYERRWGMM